MPSHVFPATHVTHYNQPYNARYGNKTRVSTMYVGPSHFVGSVLLVSTERERMTNTVPDEGEYTIDGNNPTGKHTIRHYGCRPMPSYNTQTAQSAALCRMCTATRRQRHFTCGCSACSAASPVRLTTLSVGRITHGLTRCAALPAVAMADHLLEVPSPHGSEGPVYIYFQVVAVGVGQVFLML